MAESVMVPFVTVGNRQCLTGMQIAQHPELAAFVKRFSRCFAKDLCRDVVWFWPEGDAPEFECDAI